MGSMDAARCAGIAEAVRASRKTAIAANISTGRANGRATSVFHLLWRQRRAQDNVAAIVIEIGRGGERSDRLFSLFYRLVELLLSVGIWRTQFDVSDFSHNRQPGSLHLLCADA